MNSASAVHNAPAPFSLLLRLKLRLVRNRLNQLLDDAPVRVLVTAIFVGVIWLALYGLFSEVFLFLRRSQETAAVAIPYVFDIFFVAMLVLLAFSTAVLSYAALFTREEPAFLLAGPMTPRQIVAITYLESLFFASWAMILLGLPLMAAIGRAQELTWSFYFVFLGAFVSFVPIPGALGLLAAWIVAMWLPRSARRVLGWAVAITLIGGLAWWSNLWQLKTEGDGTRWINALLAQLSTLRYVLLPSNWVSRAIKFAMENRPDAAAFYLYVTAAHALFLSWLCVNIVGRRLQPAFGRAQSRSGEPVSGFTGRGLTSVTNIAFFHLPRQVRMLVLKDLKAFVRDPTQWSQLAILFGLLALYLFYLPRYGGFTDNAPMRALIAFLNYGAVTLIISTFTSRFVFPMISMEGRQIWLVGLWPLSRASVLWAKFQFALAVTLVAAVSVTLLSIRAIELPAKIGTVLLVSTVATCFGLCGLAVGLGARLPEYRERSAARVASGLGGTLNLIASMVLVLSSLVLIGFVCLMISHIDTRLRAWMLSTATRGTWMYLIVAAQLALGIGSGCLFMRLGIRHFERAEF